MPLLKYISVIGLYLTACEFVEYLIVRRYGNDIYRPKLRWRLIRSVILGFALLAIGERLHGYQPQPKDMPLWVAFSLLVLGAIWPRTVWIDNAGVYSCGTFGFQSRGIPWSEVSRIDSDWEEVRSPLGFRQMGTRITVLSRSGTHISHGVVQSSQSEFLDTLRRYLAREAFAPGLYDWHPSKGSKRDRSLHRSRRL